jgi:DNA-binding NtrC family response regulator
MSELKLDAGDREFFEMVARAAYANPFSRKREELDREIAGGGTGGGGAILGQALVRLGERVGKLEGGGRIWLGAYGAEDREALRSALLFDAFHRHLEAFDRLILEQEAAGDVSCPAPFASGCLEGLRRRGFPPDEARRLFAVFYQLRRAFYLIRRNLVGRSSCMRELRVALWNNVFTHDVHRYEQTLWNRMEDFSTVLLGETGVGKGAAASAIGRSGFIPFDEKRGVFEESFTHSFASLNLSQFPESLIESELFGHKKGAFTGAIREQPGVFARCSPRGAIFLDEIGDVSAPVQIKLLQVLQDRVFSPVGSHEKVRFSGRVIAATNKPLADLRRRGVFRDDFYYRLCSDLIRVPSLRQRIREDAGELPLLVSHVVRRLTGGASEELAGEICRVLRSGVGEDYAWPGNVRELEQAARRVLLCGGYEGERGAAAPGLRERMAAGIEGGTLTAEELLSGYCRWLYERHGTYEEVARRAGLDRRTAKKHVSAARLARGGPGGYPDAHEPS